LQFSNFFQSTLLPFSLLFFPATQNRPNSTIILTISIIVCFTITIIIIRWSFLWSFLWRKTNLMRNIDFPVSWSIWVDFVKLGLSTSWFLTLNLLRSSLKFVCVLTHDLIIKHLDIKYIIKLNCYLFWALLSFFCIRFYTFHTFWSIFHFHSVKMYSALSRFKFVVDCIHPSTCSSADFC
jgi:hypothetical protein